MEINGYKLPHKKTMSMNDLKSFNKPKLIYLPVYNSKLKVGAYIYKGQIISTKEPFGVNIISSVSGHIKEIKNCLCYGKIEPCFVIENDLLEKYKKEPVQAYAIDKEKFENIIKNAGIIGMGGAGFPANIKYKTDKKITTLLINAVECEPYITSDYTIMREKCEELLKIIEKVLKINKIKKAILAIKITNKEVIQKFEEVIGSYPTIELKKVRNIYPMGWERTLIRETLKKEYKILPIELGIVVNNISTIYAIGQAINYGTPLIERIITVTGEGVENPTNTLVKIGTKVKDLLKQVGQYDKTAKIVSGGPMMGKEITEDAIITPDMNCILILNYKEENEKQCLRCSKCVTVCPARIHPVLIKDNLNYPDELKKLHPELCIGCGLCSYICPSRIDVRECVSKAKEVIK